MSVILRIYGCYHRRWNYTRCNVHNKQTIGEVKGKKFLYFFLLISLLRKKGSSRKIFYITEDLYVHDQLKGFRALGTNVGTQLLVALCILLYISIANRT